MKESDPDIEVEYQAGVKRLKLRKARERTMQDIEGMEETDSELDAELLKEAKLEQVREEVRGWMDYKRTERQKKHEDAVGELLVWGEFALMLFAFIFLLIFTWKM